MRKLFISFAALLLVSAWAASASLTRDQLPEGATWYVHINLESLRGFANGTLDIQAELDEAFEDIREDLHIDLSRELHAITVFGERLEPKNGTLVAHGDFSINTQRSLLDKFHLGRVGQVVNHRGADIYQFRFTEEVVKQIAEDHGKYIDADDIDIDMDDEGPFFSSFVDNRALVLSRSQEQVERFIDSNGRLGANLRNDTVVLAVIDARSAMVQGGVDIDGAGIGDLADTPMLNQVDQIAFLLADQNGDAAINVEMITRDEQTARQIRDVVGGLIALKSMMAEEEPQLAELMRDVRVDSNGSKVELSLLISSQTLSDLADDHY